MKFTNEYLKRLKEKWPANPPHPDRSCCDQGFLCRPCEYARSDEGRLWNALIARLEAAEACARTGMNYRLKREEGSRDWKEHLEYFDANWSKWRSIAGQDPTVYQRDKWRKTTGK